MLRLCRLNKPKVRNEACSTSSLHFNHRCEIDSSSFIVGHEYFCHNRYAQHEATDEHFAVVM